MTLGDGQMKLTSMIAAAAALMPAAAFAQQGTAVSLQQNFNGQVWGEANVSTASAGAAALSASAAANAFDGSVYGDNPGVFVRQNFWGQAGATLNANVGALTGDSSFTSRAIANGIQVSAPTSPNLTADIVQNAQIDPRAVTALYLGEAQGVIAATSTAASNQTFLSAPQSAFVSASVNQANAAGVDANTTIGAGVIVGGLNTGAQAFGNSIGIEAAPAASLALNSMQSNAAQVRATLTVGVGGVGGGLIGAATAVGNGYSILRPAAQ
jgi:hypothetical protein